MIEPKEYGAHIPNQRVKHSSKKDWILSANEEVQRHLEIFKKIRKELWSAKYSAKIGIKWLELFLITGDYEDEEMVLKLHRELREIKDLIK